MKLKNLWGGTKLFSQALGGINQKMLCMTESFLLGCLLMLTSLFLSMSWLLFHHQTVVLGHDVRKCLLAEEQDGAEIGGPGGQWGKLPWLHNLSAHREQHPGDREQQEQRQTDTTSHGSPKSLH